MLDLAQNKVMTAFKAFNHKDQETMSEQEHYQQSLINIRHIQYIVLSYWLLQCNEEVSVKGEALVM